MPNVDGNIPLQLAIINGHAAVVQHLLTIKGINVNVVNRDDKTPLLLAIKRGRRIMVQALLHAGADVNQYVYPTNRPYSPYSSPLHMAVRYGRLDLVRDLLQVQNIQINIQNSGGETPLHYAVVFHLEAIVRELLQAGADYNLAPGEYSLSPLGLAKLAKNTRILQIFREHIARPALTFLTGLHGRIGANSPVSLLNGFPHITDFIGQHAKGNIPQQKDPELL